MSGLSIWRNIPFPQVSLPAFSTTQSGSSNFLFKRKKKLAWVSPQANRGYVAPGREKVTQLTDKAAVAALREASPDLKESLEIGKEPSTDFHNNWPAHDPSFRPAMMRFFADCHALHLDVLDAVALGLGLSPRFFVPFCDKMDHNLRLLHYPGVPRSLLDKGEQARAGAHTDYGSITLLFQDGQGGLQVRDPATGQFAHAPPVPGAVAVNAGDMLSRWSNDIIRSTEHRVVSPPTAPARASPAAEFAAAGDGGDGGAVGRCPARYSVAFFCNPNWDAVIDCLPGCHSPARPARYPPVRCHDYLVGRLAATYA